MRTWMTVIGLVTAWPWAAAAQGPPTVFRDADRVVVRIDIREAGFVDERFLSQRTPPSLVGLAPSDRVFLEFSNLTTTSDFAIRLGTLSLTVRQSSRVTAALDAVLAATGEGSVARIEVTTLEGGAVAVGYVRIREESPVTPQAQASRPPAEQAAVVAGDPSTRRATVFFERAVVDPLPGQRDDRRPVVAIPLNGVGVDNWDFRNLRNPPYLLTPPNDAEGDALKARYLTELRGQAQKAGRFKEIDDAIMRISEEYRQAVKAASGRTRPEDPWVRLAMLRYSQISFINNSIDRTFTVTVDIPLPASIREATTSASRDAARATFEADNGVRLGDCVQGPPPVCKVVITVPFQSPQRLPIRLLAGDNKDTLLNFQTWLAAINREQPAIAFAVAFFDENATPAEPTAYVSFVPLSLLRESASKTTWALSPTLTASREPLVGNVSPTQPYDGDLRRQFSGSAKLVLKQALGSRADATVEFQFKNGAFGEKDTAGSVSVPLYQVNINSVPGVRLSFGRFLFVNPANSIAVRESGEGFRLSVRNRVSFSHLVKRESAEGKADDANLDHRVYIVEANNLAGQGRNLRGLNLMALYGRDRAAAASRRYWTAGIDLQFSVPDTPIAGTAALFHSEWKSLTDPPAAPFRQGSGNVGFSAFTYTFFRPAGGGQRETPQPRKVAATLRGEWGFGSGDRTATTTRDDGYIGETAAFSPDVLFLGMFAGKLESFTPRLTGLRQKQYFAFVYQEERFTILDIVAKILGIPDSDVSSRLLRAGARSYLLTGDRPEGLATRALGRELFLESQIETPAGVKSSFTISHFRPGSGLSASFTKEGIWSFVSKVTVTLGS